MAPGKKRDKTAAWIETLRGKLEAARQLARSYEQSKLKLRRPAPLAKVETFERQHGLALPVEYRDFFLHVGSGGGGPNLGLARFGRSMPRRLPQGWLWQPAPGEHGKRAPEIGRDFLLDDMWVAENDDGTATASPLPAGCHPYDGCVFLSDQGDGFFDCLVVKGKHAGEVWLDETEADGGLGPTGRSFRQWFEDDWLDPLLRGALLDRMCEALEQGIASPAHALIEKWQGLFPEDATDRSSRIYRAVLDLYLGRRGAVLQILARLESEQAGDAGDGRLPWLRRFVYQDDFHAAESADAGAIAAAAGHSIADVREAVANNPETPAPILADLVDDPATQVRHAVVRHSATPAHALKTAAKLDEAAWDTARERAALVDALEAVARHDNAPEALVGELARFDQRHDDPLAVWVARAAALSAAATPELLAELARHAAPPVRHAVALHPHTAPGDVERLAADADTAVRAAVASRPALPLPLMEALASDVHAEPRAQLASNPSAPSEILVRLSFDTSRRVLQCIAAAAALPERARELLARHPLHIIVSSHEHKLVDEYFTPNGPVHLPLDATAACVRNMHIFSHPSFPEPLLAVHLDDDRGMAGSRIARHPWPSPALWQQLSHHSQTYTRTELARRTDVPPEILLRLAADEQSATRTAAASNPRCPRELWNTLSRENVEGIRCAAARNPAAPVDGLKRLAKDKEKFVRRDVLSNPAAPADVVAELACDPEIDVRKWAALSPNLSTGSLNTLLQDADASVGAWARWRADAEAMAADTLPSEPQAPPS